MKVIVYAILGVIFVFCLLTLRPVPIQTEEKLLIAEGVVTEIYEAGIKDVNFKLEGSKTSYYINRGLEQGLDLENLRTRLIGEKVTIKYPDYWRPLSPAHSSKHLSILIYKDDVIFDETPKES